MIDFQSVEIYLLQLQDKICNAVEAEDGHVQFQQDQWERQEGGGGRSRTLSGGAILNKTKCGGNGNCVNNYWPNIETIKNIYDNNI